MIIQIVIGGECEHEVVKVEWGEGGEEVSSQFSKVSWMFLIEACSTRQFRVLPRLEWPQRYNWVSSACDKCSKLLWVNIFDINLIRLVLIVANTAHSVKKWMLSSLPPPQQSYIADGMYKKLWFFLWPLSGLRPILSWNKILIIQGSFIPNIDFLWGRMRLNNFDLNLLRVLQFLNSYPILFHDQLVQGKNCLRTWKSNKEFHAIHFHDVGHIRTFLVEE